MNKSLLALAVLGAFASAASAQSSVTLSGSLDAGVIRKGAGTNAAPTTDWSLGGSQSSYNNFSLSGREVLGGGMSAFFNMNHRFNIQNGTSSTAGNTVFWRNIWVGLGGGFGDVRLGRILMPLQDMNGGFDAFNTGTVGSTHVGGINATIRANQAIYYRSPSMGGLSLHAAIAAADAQIPQEVGAGIAAARTPTALLNRERPVGFNLRYAAGPLNVGVAYDRNAAELKTTGIYGAYDFGKFRLMGQYEKGDNCTSATGACGVNGVRARNGVVTTNGKDDVDVMSIGLTAPFGPVLLRTGYVRVNSDLANGDGSKFGFGGDYSLSKRTNLYATVGKSSGNRFSVPAKKAAFDLGVTHRF